MDYEGVWIVGISESRHLVKEKKDKNVTRHVAKLKEESLCIYWFALRGNTKYLLHKRKKGGGRHG